MYKIQDYGKFSPRKTDVIVGTAVIIPFSFLLYSFFYMIREGMRLLTVKENFDMLILTEAEVNFYNFSYALIAVIAGFSVALSVIFDRPRKRDARRNFRRGMILNDQRVLLIFFLGSFFKLAFLYALLVIIGNATHLYLFSFYPQYKFVFIIIPVALFLNQWVHIRRVFRNKSIKYFLISAVSVLILSFGLSRINLVDYKSLNDIALSKNAQHSYGMQLPEVDNYIYSFSEYSINFYLVYDQDSAPIILYNGNQIDLTEIIEVIDAEFSFMEEFEFPYLRPRLNVDKNIRMGTLSDVLKELSRRWFRIHLGVIPKVREFDKGYYIYQSLPLSIYGWNSSLYEDSVEIMNDFSENHIVSIEQTKYGDCLLNGQYVVDENLFDSLLVQITENIPNYIVLIDVNNETNYNDFIFVYTTVRSIPMLVREDLAQEHYGLSFESLSRENQDDYKRKIPTRIMILTDANRDLIESIINEDHSESE